MEAAAISEPTDEVLMHRVKGGDDAALAALMVRWEIPLERFLYRLLFNEADAEDLAEETFVRLFTSRSAFRDGARFSPWILTIAANLARNRRRWWRRHPVASLEATAGGVPEAPAWEPVDPAVGPAEQASARERAAAVRAAVSSLPHDLREVVVLSEFEEKPHAEIAEILGCSRKAVETRLYRARERLRRALFASDSH